MRTRNTPQWDTPPLWPHLILDNLPVSEVYVWEGSDRGLYYRRGYPLGTPGNKTHTTLVNNHLAFTVKIHKPEGLPGWRIVGFARRRCSHEVGWF